MMNLRITVIRALPCAPFLFFACMSPAEEATGPSQRPPSRDESVRRALEAVDNYIREHSLAGAGSKNLERVIIERDAVAPEQGIRTGAGDEGGPREEQSYRSNIHILRFGTGGGDEEQARALEMWRVLNKPETAKPKA